VSTHRRSGKVLLGPFESLRARLPAVAALLAAFAGTPIAQAQSTDGYHAIQILPVVVDTASYTSRLTLRNPAPNLSLTVEALYLPASGTSQSGPLSCGTFQVFAVKTFESLRTVHMRVGALPQFPTNALKYNLTWSTDGLINEYCNPCEAIHQNERREVLPLEGLEHFSLDGITYEAFNTSGGLGTLCDTLEGKVETLNYKTVRYPGHRDLIKLLVEDLRLGQRRHILKDVLETSVPMTKQDVVLIFVTVSGMREGHLTQESYAKKIYNGRIGETEQSAIQITTAAGICAMVDLLRDGKLRSKGFVRQEDASLSEFVMNRFGRAYA